MRVNITEDEKKYLLSIIPAEQKKLIKKLKNIRQRKNSTYNKCIKNQEENLKKIDEIVKNNYEIKNKIIYERLKISKATFYKNYAIKTKELKKKYKSQSLF